MMMMMTMIIKKGLHRKNHPGMDMNTSNAIHKCPRCGEMPGFGDTNVIFQIANDGGSTVCRRCRCLHHACARGKIVIGSPGPASCARCISEKEHPRPKVESKPVPPSPLAQTYQAPIDQNPSQTTLMMNTRLPYSLRMNCGRK
jgi:hypothetical protein